MKKLLYMCVCVTSALIIMHFSAVLTHQPPADHTAALPGVFCCCNMNSVQALRVSSRGDGHNDQTAAALFMLRQSRSFEPDLHFLDQ